MNEELAQAESRERDRAATNAVRSSECLSGVVESANVGRKGGAA